MMAAFEAELNAMAPEEATAKTADDVARAARLALGALPGARAWIAETDGLAAGFLDCQTILWMDDAAPALRVSDLYVAPDARGCGVARGLIAAAQEAAARIGARRLVLTVWDRNDPARAFYARIGAVRVDSELLMQFAV
jgi:GNAT superfamily N-acetyltransferase